MLEKFEKDMKNYGQMTIIELKNNISFNSSTNKDKYVMLEKNIVSYLNNLTVMDLREIAKQYNISTSHTKSDLIELLTKPVAEFAIIGGMTNPKSEKGLNTITEKAKEGLSQKSETFINGIKKEDDLPSDNVFALKILPSTKDLKQYLENLIYIESEIQFLKKHLTQLQICRAINEKKLEKTSKEFEKKFLKKLKYLVYNCGGEIEILRDQIFYPQNYIDQILTIESDIKIDKPIKPILPTPPTFPALTTLSKPLMPTEPIYKKPSFFNKKKIAIYNAELKQRYDELLNLYKIKINQYEVNLNQNNALQKKYEKDLEEYEIAQSNYQISLEEYKKECDKLYCAKEKIFIKNCKKELSNKKIEMENLERKAWDEFDTELQEVITNLPESHIKLFLTDEINLAKKELRESVKVRNKLYAYNIIYGKYRNFVALSSIYEYIDSGRCETLDGPNGAYNLFENELRSNLIISNLSLINNSLEQIKENQFLLYKEMKDVNKNLKSLESSLQSVIYSLEKTNFILEDINNTVFDISCDVNKIKENTTTMTRDVSNIAIHSAQAANNTAITAYNSAITAHYSKLTAKRVDALGFLIAMK